MLIELALLPFGYSDEQLDPTNPLTNAARRYEALLTAKKAAGVAKCKPQAGQIAIKSRKPKARRVNNASVKTGAQKRGAA